MSGDGAPMLPHVLIKHCDAPEFRSVQWLDFIDYVTTQF